MLSSKIITLCYRKIIDTHSVKAWDKLVFEDSFAEFRMQAQSLDQRKQHRTFGELLQKVPGAEQLHFLVSAAIVNYLRQLNGKVPDITDNLGKLFLPFDNFQFEIINSDRADIKKHQVAINFYSHPLYWHESISDYLVLSDAATTPVQDGSVAVHQLRLSPYVSIHTLKYGQHER